MMKSEPVGLEPGETFKFSTILLLKSDFAYLLESNFDKFMDERLWLKRAVVFVLF